MWEIEVLLGSGTPASAILTFDGESGPRYLYRIDPAAFDAVRAAGGLPPATRQLGATEISNDAFVA